MSKFLRGLLEELYHLKATRIYYSPSYRSFPKLPCSKLQIRETLLSFLRSPPKLRSLVHTEAPTYPRVTVLTLSYLPLIAASEWFCLHLPWKNAYFTGWQALLLQLTSLQTSVLHT